MKLFTGSFTHSIDVKNRVAVPRKILEVLRRLGSADEVFLTPGLDKCLFLYTPAQFEHMSDQVDGGNLGEKDVREFSRTFYSNAEQCPLDKNGRMLLPEKLKRSLGLGDKLVFAGVGRRVELWTPEAWEERSAKSLSEYERQAKEVLR
jgi:MraZ protein